MRLVRQRLADDCGVACVAMLAGVPYLTGKKAVFGNEPAGLTKTSEIKRALAALGRSPAHRLIPLSSRDYRTLAGPALLKVNLRTNREWHWVVWSGTRLLNPKQKPYSLSRLRPVSYLAVK